MIKSRRMRWAGNVARTGEMKNAYKLLIEEPEGKRLLGRPWSKWEGNIKMYFGEIGLEVVYWFLVAQDRTAGELL
jgi:hypothetical protein